MPVFDVTDPVSKTTLRLEGDSPPTETELEQIFSPENLKFVSVAQGINEAIGIPGKVLNILAAGAEPSQMGQEQLEAARNPIRTTRPGVGISTSTGLETAKGGSRVPVTPREVQSAELEDAGVFESVLARLGAVPENVPSGKELVKAAEFFGPGTTGIGVTPQGAEFAATLGSSAAKTIVGIANWMTSPSGATQMGLATVPGLDLAVAANWLVDMVKGGKVSLEEAGRAYAKGDWQGLADNLVSAGAMALGVGVLGAHTVGKAKTFARTLAPQTTAAVEGPPTIGEMLNVPRGTLPGEVPSGLKLKATGELAPGFTEVVAPLTTEAAKTVTPTAPKPSSAAAAFPSLSKEQLEDLRDLAELETERRKRGMPVIDRQALALKFPNLGVSDLSAVQEGMKDPESLINAANQTLQKGAEHAQDQITQAGGLPPEQRQPAIGESEVQAQGGTALGQGADTAPKTVVPAIDQVFWDDAVKAFTAIKFDERFGNMHGTGATEVESIADLQKNIDAARKHGTWRSVEHPKEPEVAKGKTLAEQIQADPNLTPEQKAEMLAKGPESVPEALIRDLRADAAALVRRAKLDPGERATLAKQMEEASWGNYRPLKENLAYLEAKYPKPPPKIPAGPGDFGRSIFNRETAEGGDDILSWISENMRMLSPTAALRKWGKKKFEENKSMWEGLPGDFDRIHRNMIFGGESGPDTVAKQAHLDNPRFSDDPNTFWKQVEAASKKRLGVRSGKAAAAEEEALRRAVEEEQGDMGPIPEDVRPEDVWNIEPEPPAEGGMPPSQDLGAHVPSAAAEPGDAVTNMFAGIDRDRIAMGKKPMAEAIGRTWTEDEAIALANIKRNPDWLGNLLAEVTLRPRPLLSWENAGLVFHRAKLVGELHNAFTRINRAFEDGNQAGLLEEKQAAEGLEAQIEALDKAVGRGGTGSEAGRSLNAQKMGLTDDLTLVEMTLERRAMRARSGKEYSKEQRAADDAEIAKLHKEYAERLAKDKEDLAKSEEENRRLQAEAVLKDVALAAEKAARERDKIPSAVRSAAERIVKQVEANAAAARQRIRERMSRTSAGLDPTVLLDVAEIGVEYIVHGIEDFAKWSAEMASDLGDWVKPHLQEIWKAAHKTIAGIEATPAVKRAAKRIASTEVDPEKIKDNARDKIKAKIEKGKENELFPIVRKMAEAFWIQGIREVEPMIDAIHGELKNFFPEMTRLEAADALSNRGKFTLPNQDEVKKGVRQISAEARLVGHIMQLMEGDLELPRTGPQRDKPSAKYRQLTQQLNELSKRLGVTDSNPETMLANALQAAKTYTRNRIADLKQEIAARERIVKTKTPLQSDAELEAMRAELKQVQADHEAVFGRREPSLESRKAALERTIARMEKELTEGKPAAKPKPVDRPADPMLEPLKQRRDQLVKELAESRKKPEAQKYAERQQRQLDDLNKKIAEREAKLASGDLSAQSAGKASRPMATPELEKARQELDAVNKQISEARKSQARAERNTPEQRIAAAGRLLDRQIEKLEQETAALEAGRAPTAKAPKPEVQGAGLDEKRAWLEALRQYRQDLKDARNPKLTPEQRLAKTISSRIASQLADYMTRLANGDYATRPKRQPVRLSAASEMNRAQLLRLKEQWRVGNERIRLQERANWQKAAEWVVKWERAFKLSSPVVFGKLSAAAVTRVLTTATEEIAGVPISIVMHRVAAQAPREGMTSLAALRRVIDPEGTAPSVNARLIAKGLTRVLMDGMRDANATLTKGGADIDVIFGGKIIDKEWASFLGQMHGMMKAPIKRAEYEFSLAKRIEHAIRNNEDISDRAVLARLKAEALDDGYRTIFMQHGFVADSFNNFVSMLEKRKDYQPVGEISARVLRFLFPIVRVPINIVGETAAGVYGIPVAGTRVLFHMINGTLDHLDPKTADSIMRQVKKGSVGAGLMAIGYFNSDKIGGYDWRKKRGPEDAKAGGFQVPFLAGVGVGPFKIDKYGNLPRWVTHAPWFELMQIGATIHRVKDEYVRKTGEQKGIGEGLWAAGLGLTEETPFVGEMLRMDRVFAGAKGRADYFGQLIKGALVPGALEKIAQWTDLGVEKRKPESIIDHVKMGVPGLRQQVPAADQVPDYLK